MIIHASAVALNDRAILIRGSSGSGKSALALELIGRGASLVADDRTKLAPGPGGPVASCPPSISGLIEVRGVGLLRIAPARPTRVTLVIDMDRVETERLPQRRLTEILGYELPLLHKSEFRHFPAALMVYLAGGEWEIT